VQKNIFFPDVKPQWDGERDCVVFPALVDGKRVRCDITMEALGKMFRAPLNLNEEGFLRAYEENKSVIYDLARKKILAGEFNFKGEIMIRTDDAGAVHQFDDLPTEDPELRRRLQAVRAILADIAGEKLNSVSLSWEVVRTPDQGWFCQLIVKDSLSKSTVVTGFSSQELKDLNSLALRLQLIRLWGDLLELRTREQHKKVDELVGSLTEE